MADTMPIRIPISFTADQLEATAQRSAAAMKRVSDAYGSLTGSVSSQAKSYEALRRDEERLAAQRDRLAKKLDDLRASYEQVSATTGATSDETAKLANEISKTEKAISKTDRALETNRMSQYTVDVADLNKQIEALDKDTTILTASLRAQGDEEGAAAAKTQALLEKQRLLQQVSDTLKGKIDQAKKAFGENSNEVVKLSAALNNTKDKQANLAKQIEYTTGSIKNQGDEIKSSTAEIVQSIGQIVGAQNGLKQVGDALTNSITRPVLNYAKGALEAALSNEAMEASFDAVFKNSADGARKWSESVSGAMDVNEFRVREMMSSWKIMFDGMEIKTKSSASMIQDLTTKAYDLAALYDSDVETAFQKLRAGIVGSSEPLRQWGIIINENQVKQFAWKNGIAATGKELSEQQKILARYGLILKQTEGAQGRWNEEGNTTSGMLRTNQERMEELKVSLGNDLLPLMQAWLEIIQPIVAAVSSLNPGLQKTILVVAGLIAVLGPVLKLLGSLAQIKIAGSLMTATKAATGFSTFLSGPFWGTVMKVVAVVLALAAAIALVAGLIALANGNMARYQEAMNQTKGMERTVAAASNGVRSINRGNARGTRYYDGGETWVGEEGPERVVLPQGTRIYPADQSRRMGGGDTYIFNVSMDEVGDLMRLTQTTKNAKRLARMKG